MSNIKNYSYDQTLMIPVNLKNQVLPGTFEYTLNTLIDKELDLSIFHEKIRNDETGAPAYDPAILLKIILFSYSRGIISSREIARFCNENVVCIALSADTRPHFTTIANFIANEEEGIVDLFTKVLSVCYTQNLIGKNMFAIDGCKLSSNCSKEWSGTKKELLKKAEKIEQSIKYLVEKQKLADKNNYNTSQKEKEEQSIKHLKERAKKVHQWLETNEAKIGASGKEIKSNIIDNESAKMSSGHGVIQGYNGIAAVDELHQVIVWGEAFGDTNESGHLSEILNGVEEKCKASGISKRIYDEVVVTADSGFHSEKNMEMIDREGITAFIADNQFRKRDVRFQTSREHKKKIANWKPVKVKRYYSVDDFTFHPISGKLICPAGFSMWKKNPHYKSGKYTGVTYMGHVKHCVQCDLRSKCIRKAHTKARQVTKIDEKLNDGKESYTTKMRMRFDTPEGRSLYSKRMGIVEPVFGHMREVLRLNRFTLRGKKKVNNQWLLYCMVHNIGKVQRYGVAA